MIMAFSCVAMPQKKPAEVKPLGDVLPRLITTDQLLINCPDPKQVVGMCPSKTTHFHRAPAKGYARRKKEQGQKDEPALKPLPRFSPPCRYGLECKKETHDHRFDQFDRKFLGMSIKEMSAWKKLIPKGTQVQPKLGDEAKALDPDADDDE